jgi:hypothetical protein
MCLLVTDCQLNALHKFCTNDAEFSIVGIDPTCNLGEFSVSVCTYRHLQLIDQTTNKNLVLLGPLLVHQKKSQQSYHFMVSSMVGLCPQLSSLICFGTDGEKAIAEAFKLQFQKAAHLLCFLHVKDRISMKLKDIGVPNVTSSEIIKDIFGF